MGKKTKGGCRSTEIALTGCRLDGVGGARVGAPPGAVAEAVGTGVAVGATGVGVAAASNLKTAQRGPGFFSSAQMLWLLPVSPAGVVTSVLKLPWPSAVAAPRPRSALSQKMVTCSP